MRPVYMEVTPDKFELPVAVADSAYELAALRKVRVTNILHAVNKTGNYKRSHRSKYIKVWVEDEQ